MKEMKGLHRFMQVDGAITLQANKGSGVIWFQRSHLHDPWEYQIYGTSVVHLVCRHNSHDVLFSLVIIGTFGPIEEIASIFKSNRITLVWYICTVAWM